MKKIFELILFCYLILFMGVDIIFEFGDDYIEVICEVRVYYKIGVEMEVFMGVSVVFLMIWDMVKVVEKDENG